MLYGRSFENSASSDWVGDETVSEVVKTKISCCLICSLNPNIILTCLQSQTPLYPQSALACSNRIGAVLAWTSWNLSIEPTLMVIPAIKVFGLVLWSFPVQTTTWGPSHHLIFPPLPLNPWEYYFCLHRSQNKYFFPRFKCDRHMSIYFNSLRSIKLWFNWRLLSISWEGR